ncbi:MAG: acylneuraminate cytidylyltransferase [Bacilli bacterium]|jgi:CMP-N-acetylneuraminic acid synthetase|uniref:acylneuraminate cytidylyltransferase family protein n=1 Tax=Sporofaciens musculi TaxID=2681861 RepID=UPI0025A2552F|nr:acylneuraminate cytidylyltransferase [Sporofaciens musculi]MCI8548738.1 acylneuraminate cytidylyltransferase [Bacilli bacterium]
MKVVAVVPVKTNNERLPGKNTRPLGKIPLIQYCLDTLLQVEEISELYVYCSDDSIERFLPYKIKFLSRSRELDKTDTNFTQIFDSFIEKVDADIYVYAHATAPFVKTETIRKEICAVMSGDFDSAFCAEKIQDFLWKDGTALNFDASNIPRSQDLPIIWRETSGVYVLCKSVFTDLHKRVGNKPYIAQVTKKEAVDINTYEDFRLAEMFLEWNEE